MKRPHLLRVETGAADFAALVDGARVAGIRVGWLDLSEVEPPPGLESAAALGVLRAVAVGGARTVAVKPRTGPPVLGDLLREHFLGCGLVLVLGDVDAPLLALSKPESPQPVWTLRFSDETATRWTTRDLVARLRSPRPLAGRSGSGC